MELKDFVSETVRSIIEGVKDAQDSAKNNSALVNPGGLSRGINNKSNNSNWDNSNNVYEQPVSFDVAVTIEEQTGGKGTIKVLGGIINADVGGQATAVSGSVNRVQFVIPVMLPVQEIANTEARIKTPKG